MSREIAICEALLTGIRGVMYDVGHMHGGSCHPFWGNGWEIHAFEPNPKHTTGVPEGIKINQVAVMDYSSPSVSFYTSPESPGVGTLTPFLATHKEMCHVPVITLRSYIEVGNPPPDFLKIDAEGHDLQVLQGYPWERHYPRLVMCEYDFQKEGNYKPILDMLAARGYSLIISEWEPIKRYGQPHTFKRYHGGTVPPVEKCWGNIIGIL